MKSSILRLIGKELFDRCITNPLPRIGCYALGLIANHNDPNTLLQITYGAAIAETAAEGIKYAVNSRLDGSLNQILNVDRLKKDVSQVLCNSFINEKVSRGVMYAYGATIYHENVKALGLLAVCASIAELFIVPAAIKYANSQVIASDEAKINVTD